MTGFFQSIITIVLFLAILGILVVIHELGHFVTARMANVRVLEFGIGFPPRAKVLRAKGETLYTLNWLPIGGFVKLAGEDGNDADDPRSFAAQRWITKMVILAAGVAMNVLLAFVIFAGIAWLASPLMGIRFHEVVPGSPAETAGLQPGEAIVAVDGERYQFIAGLTVLDGLRARPGETVVLTVDSADGTQARRHGHAARPGGHRCGTGRPRDLAGGNSRGRPTSTAPRPRIPCPTPSRSAPNRRSEPSGSSWAASARS